MILVDLHSLGKSGKRYMLDRQDQRVDLARQMCVVLAEQGHGPTFVTVSVAGGNGCRNERTLVSSRLVSSCSADRCDCLTN